MISSADSEVMAISIGTLLEWEQTNLSFSILMFPTIQGNGVSVPLIASLQTLGQEPPAGCCLPVFITRERTTCERVMSLSLAVSCRTIKGRSLVDRSGEKHSRLLVACPDLNGYLRGPVGGAFFW
jgi:hypothetical protein